MHRVSGRLSDLPLALPLALTPPDGYIPDFLSPPPAGPEADIAFELEQIRATKPAQVRREIASMTHPPPGGVPSIGKLVDTLAAYWERAVEPDWPRIRAFLQADIQHRARILVEHGPARLFETLHPMAHWHGDHLTIDMIFEGDVELAGRGLLLVPSAFLWTRPFVILNEPWQPTILYPARGIGTLWDEPAGGEALAPLLGATRARILAACDAPASTTELAGRLKLTPGGVSQHLRVLRDAGLVSAQRSGREVLYARSSTGDALLGD
ncbi:MAG: winged helix-turn-helix transcriptional regulator [Solirubrobacterales bacterium]|nr:winged helix-turn-helix transcriptional regulator [Solirubrobacterales bacterium]